MPGTVVGDRLPDRIPATSAWTGVEGYAELDAWVREILTTSKKLPPQEAFNVFFGAVEMFKKTKRLVHLREVEGLATGLLIHRHDLVPQWMRVADLLKTGTR